MLARTTPPTIEMRHIRLVARIAECGSVTAASRALNLTQPALSQQLRELETNLRTPLFIRTARRMIPTQAGEQFAHMANGVLAEVETFTRQAREGAFTEARGSIRLATECYTVYHWLPSVLRGFRERWPGVELNIRPEYSAAPLTALREGLLDLAIVHTHPNDKRIRAEALFDDELVVVVPVGHRLAQKPFVSAHDFEQEDLIIYSTADGTTSLIREVLNPAGVVPAKITRIMLTEAIIELVSANLGIAAMSRWSVAPSIRAGKVVAVPLTEGGFMRKWYVATRADEFVGPYQLDLIEMLRRNVFGGPTIHGTQRIA